MAWQEDLQALVEQSMALSKSVKSEFIQVKPVAKPTPPIIVEQPHRVEPIAKTALAPMTWTAASEREEIKQRVANFKAYQLRMQNEREGYYLKTMSRTRAIIEGTR
jgi:hypothetical protein